MTQDEIIEMARQANATEIGHKPPAFHFYMKDLEAFAKLVDAKATAKEREACAKVCDDLDDDLPDGLAGWQYGEAIRARGFPTSRGEA